MNREKPGSLLFVGIRGKDNRVGEGLRRVRLGEDVEKHEGLLMGRW